MSALRHYRNVSLPTAGENCVSRNSTRERTSKKRRDEDWASFGDALRVLSDRAYPDLDDKAKERLSLNQYLSQIEDSQVAFGVKQKRPSNVEEAVAASIELESYLNAAASSSISLTVTLTLLFHRNQQETHSGGTALNQQQFLVLPVSMRNY